MSIFMFDFQKKSKMTNKFSLSQKDQKSYQDVKIYHVYKNDKYADLPLLICCENGKKAIIPTFKNLMRSLAPNYFDKFYEKEKEDSTESKHEDGQIYSMTIPQLTDPKHVANYIHICQARYAICYYCETIENDNLDNDLIPEFLLTIEDCFEYFCISKFWLNQSTSKQIVDYINGKPLYELVAQAIYQYNFPDFDDFIESFIMNKTEGFNTLTKQRKFCKYLNKENLEKFLTFIAQDEVDQAYPRIKFTYVALKYYLSQALMIGKDSWDGEKWISVFKRFNFTCFNTLQQQDLLNTILEHLTLDDEQRSEIPKIIVVGEKMRVNDDNSDDDLDDWTDDEVTKTSQKAIDIGHLYNSFSKPDEFQLGDDCTYFEIPYLGSPMSMVSNLAIDRFYVDYEKCCDVKPHSSDSSSARTIRIGWTAGKKEIDWENYFFLEFDCYRTYDYEEYYYDESNIKPAIDISYNIMTEQGPVTHNSEYKYYNRLALDCDYNLNNLSFEFEKKESETGFIFSISSAALTDLSCFNETSLRDGYFNLPIDEPKVKISKWRMLIDCIEKNVDDLEKNCECCVNRVVGGRYSARHRVQNCCFMVKSGHVDPSVVSEWCFCVHYESLNI